ncbi:response regulator transcription factor [Mediterraneibacter sp. NSJ-55]|uniref:Stage 0 sporulation protein A homolog n=1 Tax=Mediterraneibacter hominis TaxID=2763054 RepID=A0A923RRQ5_9FIRM|nr:response regulator transcription factor [Mediterraneibacter hominis]MBC5689973.1 response regulator transcription factor [Mediterraneibacter hominis]
MRDTKILIVDDNPEIREIIQILLGGEGYAVEGAKDGHTALELLSEENYDLIILDIMMPEMNGYKTCVEIRKISNTPILFLSAKTQEGDKTLGFSSGGDDYLAKPFSYNELISRAKALIRRYQVYRGKEEGEKETEAIRYYDIEIHTESRSVYKNGVRIELTDTEYEMLVLLVKRQGIVFSAQSLYESVWNEPYYYGANNTVMVHIRNLRRKLEEDPKNPQLIRTIWGRGYRCG